jgi:hypothetical protein
VLIFSAAAYITSFSPCRIFLQPTGLSVRCHLNLLFRLDTTSSCMGTIAVKKDTAYYLSDIVFVLSGMQRGVYGGYPGGILREGDPGLT